MRPGRETSAELRLSALWAKSGWDLISSSTLRATPPNG
jgi:hypothetical protein